VTHQQTLGVVIATIGTRTELETMLRSIVAQARPVDAIRIVVDSDDTSLVDRIVSGLSSDLAPIDVRVLSTGANRTEGAYLVETGYGYSVNRGLETLDTDLIAFLDDDDEIRSSHFSQLEKALSPEAGLGAAYSRVEVRSPDGASHLFPEGAMASGKLRPSVLIDKHPVLLPASLIHRSVIQQVVSLDENLDRLADTDMIVRIGLTTGFSAVDDPTYVYNRISRKAVVNERVLVETAQMLKKHQNHMSKRERLLFWDTQARQALRSGLPDIGRDAAEQLVSVFWPRPPRFLVSAFIAVRSRKTPRFVKKIAASIGPKSGKTGY
jgi:glycosyltransferase involved in cell wall biosynthesis